jgi:hypothetical protein
VEPPEPPKTPQPMPPAEYKARRGKFTADDLPALQATIEVLAAGAVQANMQMQSYIKLLAGFVARCTPPLAPLQCAMSKKTLARLPRGFNLHIEENPDCFVFTVQTKEPLIKVAGVFPKP